MQITVGIPSYNEERNICNLLEALETQHGRSDIVEVIISDDSTDSTPDIVNDFARRSDLNIMLIHHNTRRGAASAWNEIFSNVKGDTIVLYDADVIPAKNTSFLLASGIRDDVVLCASNPLPLMKRKTIAARASSFNANWLRRIRRNYGLSQYTVMGRAMSIRADIARKISVPKTIIAIDLYLQCKVMGFGKKIDYLDDAIVWFKPASTMLDFVSQVVRAMRGHDQIKEEMKNFDIELPLSSMVREGISESINNPDGIVALAISYLTLPLYKHRVVKQTIGAWHVADSTKG